MDDVGLDRERHVEALEALSRVNRVSLTARRIWVEIRRLSPGADGPVRVLDVACGGGDVLHSVARTAARSGIPVELTGVDLSPTALGRAQALEVDGASFAWRLLDVCRDPLPTGHHLVCSSLFLHHLDRDGAVGLLASMAAVAERTVLVQDLRRTRLGYALAWLGLHTLTRSEIARHDGLVSVRAAFSLAEARELAARAGLAGAGVDPAWPQRFVIRWSRS